MRRAGLPSSHDAACNKLRQQQDDIVRRIQGLIESTRQEDMALHWLLEFGSHFMRAQNACLADVIAPYRARKERATLSRDGLIVAASIVRPASASAVFAVVDTHARQCYLYRKPCGPLSVTKWHVRRTTTVSVLHGGALCHNADGIATLYLTAAGGQDSGSINSILCVTFFPDGPLQQAVYNIPGVQARLGSIAVWSDAGPETRCAFAMYNETGRSVMRLTFTAGGIPDRCQEVWTCTNPDFKGATVSVAFDSVGNVAVADAARAIYICSWPPSGQPPVKIDVPMQPDAIAFEAATRLLVIVNKDLSSVSWLDCESQRIILTLAAECALTGSVAFCPDSGGVLAAVHGGCFSVKSPLSQ